MSHRAGLASTIQIVVHSSQFPDQVRRDLLDSLRTRQVRHKFHYDSVKQAQKWLALHGAYSPFQRDPDCAAIYQASFQAAAGACPPGEPIHAVGLGCGGGEKDARLLRRLGESRRRVFYTACDVSAALVLTTARAVSPLLQTGACFPVVCDISAAADLNALLDAGAGPAARRVATFFGMLPNFEPRQTASLLAQALRPGDFLILSANLAPGPDYDAGVQKVLPAYENALTREWLMMFPRDLGIEPGDGQIHVGIENGPPGASWKRISAYYRFERERALELDEERFQFSPGESIRLFFSYRHTPEQVRTLLRPIGISVLDEWITASGEEGVFLCQRR